MSDEDCRFHQLRLTDDQKAQIQPLVRTAAASRKNVLFIATGCPVLDGTETFWKLQVALVKPATGEKIRKLLRADLEAPRRSQISHNAKFDGGVAPKQADVSATDILRRIYGLVGNGAVLLPIPFRSKSPRWPGWQNTSFETTRKPDYQASLDEAIKRRGNIGVLLGPPSENLVAIDFDNDALIERFLALNPKLAGTLRSRARRGCQLWLRLKGEYPAKVHSLKINDIRVGEWRGGGCQSVLFGEHPDSTDDAPIRYQRVVVKPALEIAFKDINWPADLVLPWKEKKPQAKAQCSARPASADLHKRISAYVAAIPGAVSGQGGHDQTFKTACQLVNGWALSAEEALGYLQAYNQRCEPPWSEKELAHKIDSAQKALHAEPAGHLRGSQG
jgi:hypothetical protein